MKPKNRKMPKTGRGGQGQTIPKAIGLGTALSLLITLVLIVLETVFVDKQVITAEQTKTASIVVWLVATTAGGYLGAKLAGQQTLPVSLGIGGCYALVLMLITGLLYGAKFDGVLRGCIWIIAAAAGAGVLASKPGSARGRKHRFR